MKNKISEIGQIAITVSDIEAALGFYREILGLEFLFSPSSELAFLSAGNIRIMLSTPQGACTVGGNSVLYFKVSDLNNVFSEIISRGVKNEREPQLAAKMPDRELWIGFIRNPDGNLVGLMEKKSRISC